MNRALISDVLAVVAEWFQLSVDDLIGRDREPHIVWPRHLATHLAYRMTGQSFSAIGRFLGGRDHSTIWHSIRVVDRDIAGDPNLRRAVEQLQTAIWHRANNRFCALAILREHCYRASREAAAHG